MHVNVCVCVSIITSDSQKSQFSSSTPWGPRTKLRLSVLLPSAFTISPVLKRIRGYPSHVLMGIHNITW